MAKKLPGLFTPEQAGAVSGLSPEGQRDWRRRGFIPGFAGHARFSELQLAQLFVMKRLADLGLGPKTTAEGCLAIAEEILQFDTSSPMAPVRYPAPFVSGEGVRMILDIDVLAVAFNNRMRVVV